MPKILNNEPPRSLASSIVTMRCPRCREGKMFPHSMYGWKFMEMNSACPYCGQSFILEPGFFLGASFFSYFINGTLLTAVALALYYSDIQITVALAIASSVLIIFGLLPITLRVSKSVWIHLIIRYKGT